MQNRHEVVGYDDDEISLIEMLDFLRQHAITILGATAAFALIGAAYAWLAPARYEAKAHLLVASVAGKPVEDPALLVQELGLPLYYSAQTLQACGVADKLDPGQVLTKALKPAVDHNAPIVSFAFEAASSQQAKICVTAVVHDIQTKEHDLAQPMIQQQQLQLDRLRQKLQNIQAVSAELSQPPTAKRHSAPSASTALLLASVVGSESMARDLSNQVLELELALSTPQTRDTYLVTPIEAPAVPVWPKKLLSVAVAALAGLGLSTLWLMLAAAIRRERAAAAQAG